MSLSYETRFENELRKLLEERIAEGVERISTIGSVASGDFSVYQRDLGAIAAFREVRDVLCDEANKRLQER